MSKSRKKTGVYKFLCVINNKVYIGSSSRCLEERKKSHIDSLRSNSHYNNHFQRAWNKYGEEKFEISVIEECLPEECLDREQYWIDFYNSANPKYGYNQSPTAGSCLGYKHTLETRKRVSEAAKRVWSDPVLREKMGRRSKEKWKESEYREKVMAAIKEGLNRPEVKEKISIKSKEILNRPEMKALISKNSKEVAQRPGVNERRSIAMKKHLESREAKDRHVAHLFSPEIIARKKQAMRRQDVKEKISQKMKEVWNDPESRERMLEARRKAARNPETRRKI